MAVDAELGAIIGGGVAGALVLIAIITVIVCVCCGSRRRKKEREQKKFQQLTPHTSPSHSQPSTLGDPPPQDPRLPKVGSNGLWMGTPGIYAATPSPAYYYGRGGAKGAPPAGHPALMQRASSESRLPAKDRHVAGGAGIYAVGGNQQRIYHSQQLAALTPLYEVVDPRNGSVYDVYQIGEGSKTRLLQDGAKSGDRPSKGGKKAHRSSSDVRPEPARRPHRHKAPEEHRSSRTESLTKERAQVHGQHDRRKEQGYDNAVFIRSTEKIHEGEEKPAQQAPATDSMKLLAKNKTDDQKKVVHPSKSSSERGSSSPSPAPADPPAPDPSLHYTYGGDIYAAPDREDSKRRLQSENPILARMQAMVLEPPAHEQHDPVTDLRETAEPLIVSPLHGQPGKGASPIHNPLFQEEAASEVMAAVRRAADHGDGGPRMAEDGPQTAGGVAVDHVAVSSRPAGGDGGERTTVAKEALEPRWSVDTDAATDDMSRAGKHISVTAEAFEFLDTYLSDEDAAEIHSPPHSPVPPAGEQLMY